MYLTNKYLVILMIFKTVINVVCFPCTWARSVFFPLSMLYFVQCNVTQNSVITGLNFIMPINTLRPRQNGHHFPDDIFKCIFLNENVWIMIKNSLKFVPKGPISNIPALVQIMAWHRPGNKPFLTQCWLVYRRIYASVGLNELTLSCPLSSWCYYHTGHQQASFWPISPIFVNIPWNKE